MLKKLGLLSIAAASVMAMHEFTININDVDLETGVKFDMGQFNPAVEPDTTFVGVKMLKIDTSYTDYPDPGIYLEANFFSQREIRRSGFFAGLGLKVNYIDTNTDYDYMNIPLGVKVGYHVRSVLPVAIVAEAFYAPKVLAMQDSEGYFEYRGDVTVEIIKNASVNLGYRSLETKFSGTDFVTFNRSAYVGFMFRF